MPMDFTKGGKGVNLHLGHFARLVTRSMLPNVDCKVWGDMNLP